MARKSRRNSIANLSTAEMSPVKQKAAAYIRLSRETEESIERDSIGNQSTLVQDFIKRNDELELYDTYIDDSITGTLFIRPAFDRMLSDMRSGKIQAIVVKDLSRIGRDYLEAGKLVEHVFPLYGIRLISITDGFDTDKDVNSLMMALTNLTNAMYAQDISRKINASMQDMSERGIPIGKVPYGYRMNKDDPKNPVMEIDEEPASVVRRIFADFISGKGTTYIARDLNDEGVLTDREYRFKKNGQYDKMGRYKWSACTVQQILNNDTYTGRYAMNKVQIRIKQQRKRIYIPKDEWRTFEDHHPAIISKEDFERVQMMKQKKSPAGKNPPNLLKGKAFCGCCGGHMGIPDSAAKNPKYICRRKSIYERDCTTEPVLKAVVYDAVFAAIKNMLKAFLDEDSVINRYMTYTGNDSSRNALYHRKLIECRNKIRILEDKKTTLYGDFCSGLLEEEEYLFLNRGYTNQMQEAASVIQQIEADMAEEKKAKESIESVREKIRVFKGRRKLSREMVEALVDAVTIYSKDRIEVRFSFDDELAYLMEKADGKEAGYAI